AEENKSETVSGSIDTKLLINVYGSPATGKSFTAQNITAILHENGIDCEYIAEYATELIQQGRTDELKDQITVTSEQRRREVEAFKRTNLVITDSPTALGMLYSPKEQKAEVIKFGEQSDKTPHINILLRHNAESLATFSMNGRIHGKEESLRIQSEIVAMLQGKECLHFERGMSIEKLINDIRSTQQWQHFARSQSVEEKERTLRIAKCLQGEPVCVINDRQAPHKGMKSAKDWANAIFDKWGNKVISPELGEIVVNVHSVNDTFAHGLSPFKIEAIRSIKDVVEQGVVFAQTRVEDRDHYFIAAPITLENQVDIVSVLVHKDMNTQRMYLHSVMIREKILEKNFEQNKTPEHLVRSADSRKLSEPNRKLYSGDVGRILQNYLKVNIQQLEVEINQQIEQQKGNKMDEMTEQTVSGNLKDAVSWFDTQTQFQWSNGATNYYKQEAQFIVDTVTKYPHKDGEPFVAISGSPEPKTETQPQVDEPKNFVQNQANSDKMPQNSPDNSILGVENASKSTQDLTSNLSHPETFQKQVLFAKVPETEVSKMIDEIAKSRTYLAVDFDNKDAAKAAGAKYDPQAKGWYAQDLTPELRQFLPQQPENITAERRPYTDLMANAQKIGVDLNNQNFKEEFDKWIRVPLQGKGARNTDGGYKLFRNEDGTIGGCVKNYSTNDTSVWNDRIQNGKQIQSKVPLPDYLANKRQQEWNTIAKHNATQQVYALRSETATAAYHQLQPALPDDPYIKNKGIAEIGKLKRLDDGSTIVPLYNNGKLANLQMIPSYDSSQKRMMTQAAKVGAYYSIGNTKTPSVVIVAEGVATADSVHQIATEIYGKDSVLTLSAIDSGNLPNVAAKVQHNFPAAQKIVAADNDAHNATRAELKHKNAGLDKANEVKQAYPDFQVALCPALTDEKGIVKNTDWNDFLKAQGKATSVKAFANNEQYIQQYSVKQPAATPQMTAQKTQQNNQGRSL
ncbi:MAG: hypothetical protein IJ143_06135, partial [Neisseriaceae bacterium]|nr:hypothetical protein [Neisseriaceae bacterium]